jgi:hypothetical protein
MLPDFISIYGLIYRCNWEALGSQFNAEIV